MGADEEGTLARLQAHRKDLIDPAIAEHNGRIVKLMGDGTLVEFASAVDAVRCAVQIQRGMRERNLDTPEGRRMELRIGINLGDVMIDGDDLYGDGVNVAARLEALAKSGTIYLSEDVYRQVRGKLDVTFDDVGRHTLKNIVEPVQVYRVSWADGAAATTAGVTPSIPGFADRPAIAVLPFDNISGDPDQEYFADGLTEDIITALSYWRWFPVIARNSTFAYKGQATDVRRVAEELGARYLLEGSVRKSASRVRISAQLIDAQTGHHIWAQRYDREVSDIFALQDEITGDIVVAIEPQLHRAEQQRALRKTPESLDTWDLSLRALWHIRKTTRRDYAQAHRLLLKAIKLDPASSYAQTTFALCNFHEALLGWVKNPPQRLAATFDAAKRAVELDEDDALAHALLGIATLWTRHRYDDAIQEGERAIALNPSAAMAHYFLGCVLGFAGRPEDTLEIQQAVLRLDPRFPFRSVLLADLSLANLLIGKLEDAVTFAEKAIADTPGNVRAHQRLVASLGLLGDVENAKKALAKLKHRQPDFSVAYIDATYPFKDPAHRRLFLDGLRRAGWED
jgi:TolB-like protein/Tfp pilus assembly protein PilF